MGRLVPLVQKFLKFEAAKLKHPLISAGV